MDVLQRIGATGIVPVVVLEDAANAVPTARALLAGGIDVMEITFRTAAAEDSIKAVANEVPEMLVGAGTVLNAKQAKTAVDAGARFIVSPGFDGEMVKWCIENNVAVTPGCVTPTEIMAAVNLGLNVLKFFPAGVYGGLSAMKALSGPFGKVKFIPTGGVNADNLSEFSAAPFIHAVGGSWLCSKADISEGNFEKITKLSCDAVAKSLGIEIAHVGINMPDAEAALETAEGFDKLLNLGVKDGNSSVFAGSVVEVMKTMYLGKNGHIGFKVNNVARAVAYFEKHGFKPIAETMKYKNDRLTVSYIEGDFGGFAVHFVQK